MKIGDKVILTKDIVMWKTTYKKGHIFTIYNDSGFRGWDLIDADGNKIDETLFVQDSYELYNIREERKEKLNRINSKIFYSK